MTVTCLRGCIDIADKANFRGMGNSEAAAMIRVLLADDDQPFLDALSPLAVLARGFAVAYREGTKRPILAAQDVAVGERLRVRLHKGELGVIVRDGGKWLDPGPLFADPQEEES